MSTGLFMNQTRSHRGPGRSYIAHRKALAEWPREEVNILCEMIADGLPFSAVATALSRSKSAVHSRWRKIVRAMGAQAQ